MANACQPVLPAHLLIAVLVVESCVAARIIKTQPTSATTVHVIGDTHGDTNYLVRCLLSTELFVLSGPSLLWRSDVDAKSSFEVVILGDMIDRGTKSKGNLELLRTLSAAKPFGSRMHVLLGNHEDLTLVYGMNFWKSHNLGETYMNGDWTSDDREISLRSTSGPDYDLIRWLGTRKVAHQIDSVLMMHGGFSEALLSYMLKLRNTSYVRQCSDRSNPKACGLALVEHINGEASNYYEAIHKCILEAKPPSFGNAIPAIRNFFDERHAAKNCSTKVDRPVFLDGLNGLLNYRGFSSIEYGAGSEKTCTSASRVGKALGADVMVVAHTTHYYILKYCNSGAVPVLVTDTHRLDCAAHDECDFDPSVTFHKETIDRAAKLVPQSVRLELSSSGKPKMQTCLSHVAPRSEPRVTAAIAVECGAILNAEDQVA